MKIIVQGQLNGQPFKQESEVDGWTAVSIARAKEDGTAHSVHTLGIGFVQPGRPVMAIELTTADAIELREDLDRAISFASSHRTDQKAFSFMDDPGEGVTTEAQLDVENSQHDTSYPIEECEECHTTWQVTGLARTEHHRSTCSKFTNPTNNPMTPGHSS